MASKQFTTQMEVWNGIMAKVSKVLKEEYSYDDCKMLSVDPCLLLGFMERVPPSSVMLTTSEPYDYRFRGESEDESVEGIGVPA